MTTAHRKQAWFSLCSNLCTITYQTTGAQRPDTMQRSTTTTTTTTHTHTHTLACLTASLTGATQHRHAPVLQRARSTSIPLHRHGREQRPALPVPQLRGAPAAAAAVAQRTHEPSHGTERSPHSRALCAVTRLQPAACSTLSRIERTARSDGRLFRLLPAHAEPAPAAVDPLPQERLLSWRRPRGPEAAHRQRSRSAGRGARAVPSTSVCRTRRPPPATATA
eukprot:COSAG01_NODE_8613_length_2719_cov_59.627863_3_plen_222_part_00